MASPDTASSEQPVFKKRNRGAKDVRKSESIQESDVVDDDQQHDKALIRKPTGMGLDELNKSRAEDSMKIQLKDQKKQHRSDAMTRLVHGNHFEAESGFGDVNLPMMEYVEKEMQKRGLGSEHDTHESIQLRIQDPKDALFSVTEKYRRLQKEAEQAQYNQPKRNVSEEATSTLGAAMLSKIPENIEATEKAKRALLELSQSQAGNQEKQDDTYLVPGAPKSRERSVPKPGVSLLREARLEAQGISVNAHTSRSHQRQERASDARVLTAFRKRQRR